VGLRFRRCGLRPQFSAASRADGLTASLSLIFHHRTPPPGVGVKVKPLVLRNLDTAGRGRSIDRAAIHQRVVFSHCTVT
jgi:hypothetical protein